MHKALKTLHLLRYVIVTDFYNRKQCQVSQAAETTKQTRIHPAVKSLFGKAPKFAHYTDPAIPSTSTDPRFLPNNESLESPLDIMSLEDSKPKENVDKCNNESQSEKRKLENEESRPRKIPRYVPPKSNVSENTCPSRGIRHKVRKRIIIGNISKWIPPDWREDAASHKWTMYVRGDQDNADISTFVSKVRFFLHPSYCPNDVVEVTLSPFYLSRRGWGEFPLRVQLHFKNALNKPMDIIHHLKLDRTYTGLQTLGSETLVDVWIHTTEFHNLQNNNESTDNKFMVLPTLNDTFKLGTNGSINLELFKQPRKSGKALIPSIKSEPIENNSEICIKTELTDMDMPSVNSMNLITEDPLKYKIKTEPDNRVLNSNKYLSNDLNGLDLEQARYYINRDHDYLGKEYFNFDKHTVREGNITIEHFPEYRYTTNLRTTNSNNVKLNNTLITSYRNNGEIESFTDCQFSTVDNLKDRVENNLQSLQVSLKHTDSQKNNNNHNTVLLDTNNSAESGILENGKDCSVDNNIFSLDNGIMQNSSTKINGCCKSSDFSLERFNNLQKTLKNNYDSHLKPLQISIPPAFASPTSKRILLMKNNKLIPVDVTNISSDEDTKKITDNDIKIPITKHNKKLNVAIPHGVSILKKSVTNNVKINSQQENTVKNEPTMLTLKTSNSLLLNLNYDVPALKIADSHDVKYNCNLSDDMKSIPLINKQESCTKSEDKNEKIQRSKITLGKDKHKIQSKRKLYEAVFETIETTNIIDIEALIRFIIRRLPIITQDASDPDYKQLHPYACYSETDFFAHNLGKQRALEWNRAKMIRYFLRKRQIRDDRLWSVREILIWARLHGYTPYRDSFNVAKMNTMNGMKKLPDCSTPLVLSTCTEPIAFQKWLQTCQQESNNRLMHDFNDVEILEIDVETVEQDSYKTRNPQRNNEDSDISNSLVLIPLELDKNLVPLHNFVCDSARDIGIKIGPEEIVPDVIYCAASRAIIRVKMILSLYFVS